MFKQSLVFGVISLVSSNHIPGRWCMYDGTKVFATPVLIFFQKNCIPAIFSIFPFLVSFYKFIEFCYFISFSRTFNGTITKKQ